MGLRVFQPHRARLAFHCHLVRHRAGGKQGDGRIDLAHRLGKFVVLQNVIFQRGMAELPRSIRLVADIPEFDAVGFGVPVFGAHAPPCAC